MPEIFMPAQPAKVLIICHAAAAEVAATAAQELYLYAPSSGNANAESSGHAPIDLLCYGRVSDDRPAPTGARLVTRPVSESAPRRANLRLLAGLRGRRYETVALAQPALGVSRARGLLLAASYFVSGGRAVILDPVHAREVKPIGFRLTCVDLVRWAALHVTARAVAAAAVPPLTRLAATATSARTKADGGFVAYLRTDLELSVTPLMAGGSVAHTDGILNALLTRGHDVTYLGTGTVDGIPARVACGRLYALLKGNLPVEVAELISGLIQGCMSRRKLVSLGSSPRVSFIYQRYSLNNLAGVILARRLRIPLVLEANDSEAKWRQDFGTLKYPRLAYGCERLILRQADVVATVSRNAAEDLLAAGAPSERLHVVPNGVTVSRFENASPVTLPPNLSGSFVVCFVGLFYPWHGVRFLAEAFGLLHSRRGEVGLLLVGDGEDAPVAKAVLDRSAAGAASHFAGLVPRSEVPRYMAAADVLVAPHADTEHFIGSPIKVFEYMASGKPIVATRVGQIEQVLDDGKTALLVPPEDPEAMAAAFERLYSDRALGRRLGQAAREEARANHSWDARVASIVDALHESASGDTE